MLQYPRWKYYLLTLVLCVGLIYALPNMFGEDPAVQVRGLQGHTVSEDTVEKVQSILKEAGIASKSITENDNELLVRLSNPEAQLKAKEIIKENLGEFYSVALNLAPLTPSWLEALGAKPMKLGLDLRGGVHFLMEVEINSVVDRRMDGYYSEIPRSLKEEKLNYIRVEKNKLLAHHSQQPSENNQTANNQAANSSSSEAKSPSLDLFFKDEADRDKALSFLKAHQPELTFVKQKERDNQFVLEAALSENTLREIRNDTIEQTTATLRNRVNELGVAEAIVQRQGLNRVVVQLPGIQDTAYAREILGKTATLKFLLQDNEHEVEKALAGRVVPGSKLYHEKFGMPVLLKETVLLTGDSITGATTGNDREDRPAVNIRLGGDIAKFSKITRENIGKRMAVVYVEVKDHKTTETVISLATIQSALGYNFQINGLSLEDARDLALLLRAGALPAAISIVEERIVGPSMGKENIEMGLISVVTGLALVLLFMTFYYSVFGVIANIALVANLILLLALMSLIGATLTLPGIAGIVLTLGMAVDANVLIFERIREELRLGVSPQASIHRGFEFAFATIIDSNLTTLIVGIILFAVGTGPVKGFAVTLCIGILTSLLTATTGTRALVHLLYGSRTLKRVRVGI